MKKILLSLVLLFALFALVSCGENNNNNNGGNNQDSNPKSFVYDSYEVEYQEDADATAKQAVKESLKDLSITLELKDDGSYSLKGSEEETGTYKLEGNKLTLTNKDGNSQNGTLENGVLRLEVRGEAKAYISDKIKKLVFIYKAK